jgi:hypothetical protein
MRFYPRLGYFIAVLAFMAGCSHPTAYRASPQAEVATPVQQQSVSSERLGTQWGEGVASEVTTVDLRRVSRQPVDVVEVRYSGTHYRGNPIQEALLANGRIGLSVLGDNRLKWELTQNGQNLYLQGRNGERYQLFYRNYSGNTYEIVATVDGLDVLKGSSGSFSNRGYVLYPNSTLLIEGFRKSQSEVAAFRFSAVADAYAANSEAGSPDNTGVIGTAVFELNNPRAQSFPGSNGSPQAFPADQSGGGYAPPPRYNR